MNTRVLTTADDSVLEKFVWQHENGLIYHTSGWRDIHVKGLGLQPFYIGVFEGNELCGVLPLFLTKGVMGRKLISVPVGHLCRPLYRKTEELTAIENFAQELGQTLKVKSLLIKSGEQEPFSSKPQIIDEYVLSVLPLSSEEENWQKVSNSAKRGVRKAVKSKVTVREGISDQSWTDFYQLHIETRHRQGVPVYSRHFFQAMRYCLDAEGRVKLVLAYNKENIPIAAIILLFYKDRIYYSFGASSNNRDYLVLRPNNMLFWETIKDGINNRFKILDFGYSPRDNVGLINFKNQWGSINRNHVNYIFLDKNKCSKSHNAKEKLATVLLKKMPESIFEISSRVLFKLIM